MRNITHYLLLMILVSLVIYRVDGQTVKSTVISPQKLVFDITATTWRLPGGKYTLSTEETPEGEPALEIALQKKDSRMNGGKFDVNAITKIEGGWEELSFWVKPDNSGTVVRVTFSETTPDAKKTVAYHVATVKMLGNKWKKFVFKTTWSSNKRRLDLRKYSGFQIQFKTFGKESKFLMGPITFNLKNNHIALTPLKVKNAFATSTSPKIDGKLNDDCWNACVPIKDFVRRGKGFPAEVKVCFDDNFLYIGARQARDTSQMRKQQTTPQMNVWQDDCFEFFISPNNDGKTWYQFIVNALNVKHGLRNYFDKVKDDFKYEKCWYAGKWESAVEVQKTNWSIELKIPLKDLTPHIKPNSIIGMQAAFSDSGVWNRAIRNFAPSDYGLLNMQLAAVRDQAPIKLAKLECMIDKKVKIPRIDISLQETSMPFNINLWLSAPTGKINKISNQIKGSATLKINEYQSSSGSHRITLAINNNQKGRTVYGFKTAGLVFSQPIAYGETVLLPTPKELTQSKKKWQPNSNMKIFFSKKAKETAAKIQSDLSGYLQTKLLMEELDGLKGYVVGIAENSSKVIVINKKTDLNSLAAEGYILRIDPAAVVIVGKDAPGVFYGTITLSQIERYAFLRNQNYLTGYHIRDWPDVSHRVWANWTQALLLRKMKSSHKELYAALMDNLDRIAIGSKYNMFSMECPSLIQYEKPFNQKLRVHKKGNFISIPNLRKLATHCRKNYAEFVPAANSAGHALWMTLPHPQLVMSGYSNWDANPLHPDYYKVLFSAYEEIIEATQPKHFFIAHDEWWHKPKGKVSSKYNGIEKRDIFYKEVMTIYNYLKKRGIRTTMCSDMIQRSHNGGLPYDNYLNAKKFPHDLIMRPWSDHISILKNYNAMGFSTLLSFNRVSSVDSRKLAALKPWGVSIINYDFLQPDMGYGFTALIYGGEYSWNLTKSQEPFTDWLFAKSENITALYSVLPNPAAGRKFIPINLKSLCNDSYVKSGKTELAIESLKGGEMKIGFIPMDIVKSNEAANCIVGNDKPVTIPINSKVSSLIVLHTQVTPKSKRYGIYKRNRQNADGIHTGKYTVRYNDGSNVAFFSRNVTNCGNWIPYNGRIATTIECKYLIDCRYTWTGKAQKIGIPCLYQYEWVNPHPEKTIKDVEFTSTGTEADIYLFGVTVRTSAI